MICVKVVPSHVVECINKDKAILDEILNALKERLGVEEYIVVVNGKVVSNHSIVVSKNDEVVLVQAFMGGST